MFYWFMLFSDVSFYTAAPLSLCCNNALEVYKFSLNAVAEFIVKGKTTMQHMEFDWLEFVSSLLRLRWLQWTGAVIFFWGWIHQRNCHAILVCFITHTYSLFCCSSKHIFYALRNHTKLFKFEEIYKTKWNNLTSTRCCRNIYWTESFHTAD